MTGRARWAAAQSVDLAYKQMEKAMDNQAPDRSQLEQIIAGLTEGVILIEPDQTITYANEAALEMHGVTSLDALGRTVDEYQGNFVLHYRNNRPLYPDRYPIERLIAGEVFDDVVVVVAHKDNPDRDWAHRIRSLVITDQHGDPDCLVLIVHDVSGQVEAEDRFERTFGANPAPAVICRLTDLRFIKVNEGFLQLTGYQARGRARPLRSTRSMCSNAPSGGSSRSSGCAQARPSRRWKPASPAQ